MCINKDSILTRNENIIEEQNSNRRTDLLKALEEVELKQKGILPKKSAKTFLKELRSK